ncbi:MAG: hypothetical protein NT166_25625 [Candidatus Aminicenantes bacterium]|nr:hypothetical protein [Candidatus Aminicenantes bacterium]
MKKELSPRSHHRYVGLWIFAVIIAIILTGSTFWLEKVKSSYKQDFERTQKTYLSHSRNATAMEETKQRRVEYYRNRFVADYPSRYSYGAADFMRRLSLIDAHGVELVKLEIIPHGQDLAFKLNVGVIAGNDTRAKGIFSRFYDALKNFEDMIEIKFSTIYGGSAPRGKVKLFFKIEGAIELE